MPRPIHFEIEADDVERAITFSRTLFGWEFEQWGSEKYWLIKTGAEGTPGIDGGLLPRPGKAPGDSDVFTAFVCTIDVDDIDTYVARLTDLGGTIRVAKAPLPKMGWLAYANDTEGNMFGIIQKDPGAK